MSRATTTTPIVIHQHFRAPTPDRFREARIAMIAAEAQFRG
jgi:hypothetical protein